MTPLIMAAAKIAVCIFKMKTLIGKPCRNKTSAPVKHLSIDPYFYFAFLLIIVAGINNTG